MSRFGAGFGAAVGAAAGGATAYYGLPYIRRMPWRVGRTAPANAITLGMVAVGGVIGAAVGAGPSNPSGGGALAGITYTKDGTTYKTAPRLSAAGGAGVGAAVAGISAAMAKADSNISFWAMLLGSAAGAAIGAHLGEKGAPEIVLNERGELQPVGASGVGLYLGQNGAFP